MSDEFESAKSTEGVYLLPGGFLTGPPDDLELYNLVYLREMKGKEEDILANDKLSFTERMHRVISRCIVKLGSTDPKTRGKEITDQMTLLRSLDGMLMSDTNVLFVRLRQASLGDSYKFKIRCPARDCRKEQSKGFDLSKFIVEPMKGDPRMRTRQFVTRKGDVIVWQMLTGADEKRLDTEDEYVGKGNKNDKEKATIALMARVKTINNEPATKEMISELPMLDRANLRKAFDDEGGMDMAIRVKCRSCGVEFERDLPIGGEDFFSPSDTSED